MVLVPLLKIIWPNIQEFVYGLSILFHWSTCLPLCQYHFFFTIDLHYVLKSGSMHPTTLFSMFKIVLVSQGPLRFHTNFRKDFSSFKKEVIGILTRIALKYRSLCFLLFQVNYMPIIYYLSDKLCIYSHCGYDYFFLHCIMVV